MVDIFLPENANILFLDDDENRTKIFKSNIPWCDTASTVEQCIKFLKKKEYFGLFLDHDLSGETNVSTNREDTGSEVVRWIVENKPEICQIIVHSLNDAGARHMCKELDDAGYVVIRLPFTNFHKFLDFTKK